MGTQLHEHASLFFKPQQYNQIPQKVRCCSVQVDLVMSKKIKKLRRFTRYESRSVCIPINDKVRAPRAHSVSKVNKIYQINDLSFSNLRLTHVEWLRDCCPEAILEYRRVEGCEWMPQYRVGRWDGYSLCAFFPDKSQASLFKLAWWS